MAWVDDRIYAHPKIRGLSKPARWSYVAGIAYSCGWGTRGHLAPGALEAIGCTRKEADELVVAGLWVSIDEPVGFLIRDWDEHNGKRDERRKRDRERKKRVRTSAGQAADTSRTNTRTLRVTARVEGSEGSEGSEEVQEQEQNQDQNLALTKRKPNVVWDFVTEVSGEPLPRHRTARGAIVSDLTQLLERERVDEPDRHSVLMARLTALAREWGEAKATPRALVQNWALAARLANGQVRGPVREHVTAMQLVESARESARREHDD